MFVAGRSNLKKLDLIVEINPFRIHTVDEYFFLFPAAAFYSFLFGYHFDNGVKPIVTNKFLTVIPDVNLLG